MRCPLHAALVTLVLLAGCDSRFGQSPAATDEDRARVRVALDAWRARRGADPAGRTPPIRLVDEDQAAGLVLTSFDIKPRPPGVYPPFTVVTLARRDRKGGKLQRHAS